MVNIPKKCLNCTYRHGIVCEAGFFCIKTVTDDLKNLIKKPIITADHIDFDEDIFIDVTEDELNKILEFQDLTKTETVSDAIMLAIKIAKFTLTYTKKKESTND